MKRLFINLFFIILILASLIGSGIKVKPVYAQTQQVGMEIVPLNLPSGWSYGFLYGIWGSSANDVYAVGYGHNGSALRPLLYHKVGSNWTNVDLSLPTGWNAGYLYSIWGSGPNDVYAVGSGAGNLPLVYHWNGSTWTPLTNINLPTGLGSGALRSVWGFSTNNVFVAGHGWNGSAYQPLIYHWNGSIWSTYTPSLPGGWTAGQLYGMWGSATDNVVYAVGSGNNGAIWPMLYIWNGSSWNEASPSLPLPTGWTSGSLRGIWGSADNNVYAVGSGYNGSTNAPLLERWNGSSWTASSELSLPTDVNQGFLTGIWGSSSSDVYAVGYGFKGTTTVPLLYYKGSAPQWQNSSPSHPTGWQSDHLYGVWGSSFNDVSVVGSGHNGSVDMPLLYHSSQVGQDVLAPGDVTTLTATTGTSGASVKLTWTAPADDDGIDNSGAVASYLVKYSKNPIENWTETEGTPVTTGVPVPTAPGTTQTMTVTGLDPNTQYYFAVRAQDEQYNLSANFTAANAVSSGVIESTWHVYGVGSAVYGIGGDIPVMADYNGDGRADIAVFRPSNSTWYINGLGSFLYGTVGDIPVVADYNGDGRADIAVFRPSTSTWYVYGVGSFVYGTVGDIPVVADYNGDKRADVAVFRPSNSTWYVYGVGSFVYGTVDDVPVVADYNGDKKADIAVFRPTNSTWYIYGLGDFLYGTVGDIPVIADYNGDGRADIAVFRPTNSTWYIYGLGDFLYGTVGDIPVIADYNGDKKADIAVFRP